MTYQCTVITRSMSLWHQYKAIIILSFTLLAGAWIISGLLNNEPERPGTSDTANPRVHTATPSQLASEQTVTVTGRVQAASEGYVTPETGGRIDRIHVRDGDTVQAGQILVELSNTQQRSSVAQAEAALRQARAGLPSAAAGAADRMVGIREAEANITSAEEQVDRALSQSFSTAQRIVISDIDPLYSSPRQGVPGVRIGVGGTVQTLNQLRSDLRTTLPQWEERTNTVHSSQAEYQAALRATETDIAAVKLLIDTIIQTLETAQPSPGLSQERIRELRSGLTARRDELTGARRNLDNARDGLRSAMEQLERARIADIDTDQEQAEASVAQAEASLQSARATLNETLLRAPVSGTVTDLDATVGDTVGVGSRIARVLGGGAVEIEAFVSTREAQNITVGDTVQLRDTQSGLVTRISPTIDTQTRRRGIVITAPELDVPIGEAVRVTFTTSGSESVSPENRVPIAAVQFRGTEASVMIVNEDSELESRSVDVGVTRGGFIVIESGITADTEIVTDVRGLRSGTVVDVEQS